MLKPLSILAASALLLALTGTGGSTIGGHEKIFISNYENILGTSLELKVGAVTQADADKAEAAVLAEIARESKILSAWDKQSEFTLWTETHGRPVHVSRELFEVLGLYDQWRTRTNGALDASAETVIRAWKHAAAESRIPTREELAAAVAEAHQKHWSLNAADRTATHLSDAPLVLASFTKSYIIDRAAAAAMATTGVHSVVVNIGGDIAARGTISEAVDIVDPKSDAENGAPLSQIVLHNRAVATSGDYRRGIEIGGQHYSHIVDPRSGMPADNIISSTVIASNPVDAGALATAFSILTPAESQTLAASVPGVRYLLVKRNGQKIASTGWAPLETPAVQLAALTKPVTKLALAPAAVSPLWDTSMELAVNFELANLSGPAKRPFIAIWIEDQDKFPVRTVALWYHEDRYLTEMKAWYRADRLRAMSEGKSIVRSVGSATRAPGKYTMKWDGKDNDGNLVKAGKYTVYLETSREHGTYQLLRSEIDFSGQPRQVQLQPGTEITAASFDYRKLAK